MTSGRSSSTTNDGFKFCIDDGSWLLVRFSGTEPLVRVYTEATSQAVADACIAAGEALVRRLTPAPRAGGGWPGPSPGRPALLGPG